MSLEDQITALAQSLLPDEHHYLVSVTVKGLMGGQRKVSVLMDADEGVSIDACATVSRQLGHQMEEQNFIDGPYQLEVSSPGIDFPLEGYRPFAKNIGRLVKVDRTDGTTLTAPIQEVSQQGVTLAPVPPKKKPKKGSPESELTPTPQFIPFSDIKKALIQIVF